MYVRKRRFSQFLGTASGDTAHVAERNDRELINRDEGLRDLLGPHKPRMLHFQQCNNRKLGNTTRPTA